MSSLEEYLEHAPPSHHGCIQRLHKIITKAVPELRTSLKWGNLTYHHNQNICAIIAHKNHVNLQLWNGASLDDPDKLLLGEGKRMRHITIRNEGDIRPRPIAKLIQQAATHK